MSRNQPALSLEHDSQEQCHLSSRSRISSVTKPIRLSTYHGERSQSKTKQFISQMVKENSMRTGTHSSTHLIKELHQSLERVIGELIEKLEEKRKSLLESWNEAELKEGEKLIMDVREILLKGEPPVLTINCVTTPKYSNESFSCSFSGLETTRSRGTTFPNMMNHFKAFDLSTPRGDSKLFDLKTPKSQEISGFQDQGGKGGLTSQIPLTPQAKPRPPLLRIPTKHSQNFLKPPSRVVFSPKEGS